MEKAGSQLKKVLVVCTGNTCRSPMAEGWLNHKLAGKGWIAESAGVAAWGGDGASPEAVEVMREIGIDISGHHSKHMEEFLGQKVDTVITVCGNADQACPMFPGQVNRYHWGFSDPAHTTGTEDEILEDFRRVRDQIALVFQAYVAGLKQRQ